MPKIKYVERDFASKTLEIITQANAIIKTYLAEGYQLTLRQLYYQFVSRDLIENKVTEYKRLGSIINDARLAGLIDWEAIEDRTRNLASLSHWDTPGDIIDSAAASFRVDKWETQPNRIEVWIEKEALAGVFERVCNEFDVPFFCCRGYTSQSEMWVASQRLLSHAKAGHEPLILHFGDHDPSGIDMTRDIKDRLYMFGCRMELTRLALNMDQVKQYGPPPNPAKEADSRFAGYIREYGDESWELDALEPPVLAQLVRDALSQVMDGRAWKKAEAKEKQGQRLLSLTATNWPEIASYVADNYEEGESE